MDRHPHPEVVILGGGFGGLYAAKALGDHAKVTLIEQRNFHLFQPLLYQVGDRLSLARGNRSPLRSLLRSQRDTFVLLDRATDLDHEKRRVMLASGDSVVYTHLIVATARRIITLVTTRSKR